MAGTPDTRPPSPGKRLGDRYFITSMRPAGGDRPRKAMTPYADREIRLEAVSLMSFLLPGRARCLARVCARPELRPGVEDAVTVEPACCRSFGGTTVKPRKAARARGLLCRVSSHERPASIEEGNHGSWCRTDRRVEPPAPKPPKGALYWCAATRTMRSAARVVSRGSIPFARFASMAQSPAEEQGDHLLLRLTGRGNCCRAGSQVHRLEDSPT